jgi:hypothetical protein
MKKLGWMVALLAIGCGDGGSMTAKSIGAAGGSVSAGDGTKIDVPGGALAAETMISITSTPNAAAPGATTLVGTPQTFGPEGAQFTKPVTITLAFDASKLPMGKTAADIVIWTAPAGSTNYVATEVTKVVDASHVSTEVSHFSVFAPAVRGSGASCVVACTKGANGCGCTATCMGKAYALECNTLGACACKLDGTQTTVIETSSCANETPSTLFKAYSRATNGCGFPGTEQPN